MVLAQVFTAREAAPAVEGLARARQGVRQVARRQLDGRVRVAGGVDLFASQLRKGSKRRYPVVYLLHGYTGTDLGYFGEAGRQLHRIAERVYQSGAAREMILVMPNAMNAYGGSMYSNSVTAGNWEGYIAEDLVAYMDRNYRTLATRESRGLAGHSMGGYGTMRIGMKRPDVFAAIYALSSCCLNEGTVRPPRGGGPSPAESITQHRRGAGQPRRAGHAGARRGVGAEPRQPAALSRPADQERRGAAGGRGEVGGELAGGDARSIRVNLKTLKAIALDIGLQDNLITSNQVFVEALTRFGVAHTFETYEGDHGNRIPQRLEEKVLPFFSNSCRSNSGATARAGVDARSRAQRDQGTHY